MGYNGCWVAVKGRTFDDLAREIGLERTNPAATQSTNVVTRAGTLKDGWSVFYGGRWDERLVQADMLSSLSKGAQLVACQAYEMTMFSSAQLWINGSKVWVVSHDGESGDANHLVAEGKVIPKSFLKFQSEAIRESQENKSIDFMFDVPIKIAEEISGFDHNKEDAGKIEGSEFFLMNSTAEDAQKTGKRAKKSWWKFW